MRKPFTHTDIPYGFRWGPLHVERVASDELTFGAVVEVGSDRDRFHVRVSPAGRRVQITQVMRGGKHIDHEEWQLRREADDHAE